MFTQEELRNLAVLISSDRLQINAREAGAVVHLQRKLHALTEERPATPEETPEKTPAPKKK